MYSEENTRIIISLPRYLVQAVDEAAKQHLQSRAGFIRQVLTLAVHEQDAVLEAAYCAGRRRSLQRYLRQWSKELREATNEDEEEYREYLERFKEIKRSKPAR